MKKIILWICGIIVAAAVCLGGYGYYKIHHTTSAVYSYNKKNEFNVRQQDEGHQVGCLPHVRH